GDGDSLGRGSRELAERRLRVLRLHAEKDDVLGPEVEVGGRLDYRKRVRGACPVRGLDSQALGADRLARRAAGEEHDVVPAVGEPRAENTSDRAGAVDEIAVRAHRRPPTLYSPAC